MKLRVFSPLLVVLMLMVSSPVYAVGFGLFLNGGNAEAKWDGDLLNDESNGKHLDFGFALDTNLATDRLFNYRLELGKAYWEVERFNNQSATADLDGVMMNQDFGFGGLVSESVRLWLGPELRLTYLNGELNEVAPTDIDLFGLGFGAAAGVDINFPGRMTVSVKGGYVVMDYYGNGPNWSGNWQKSDYSIDENLLYLGVSVFFRTKSSR